MPREIRLSPDGNSVAIRTDETDDESTRAWGVMRVGRGGYWARTSQVADWSVLS